MSNNITEKVTLSDISTADFSFNKVIDIFSELPTSSILRNIAAVVPMKMSTGSVVNVRRNASTNSYETVEATLTVNTISATPVSTGISVEVIQDLHNQYKEDGYKIAAGLLRGIIDKEENDALETFLSTNSLSTTALALTSTKNAEQALFEITQRVQELVLKMNTPNFRTYNAFVILPYKNAASVSSLSKYLDGDTGDSNALVVSKVGKTTYYVNPDVTSTTVYVGLVETGDKVGASSIIMGDYVQEIVTANHAPSFQQRVGIINRYATVVNPLSTTGAEMLMKFAIS